MEILIVVIVLIVIGIILNRKSLPKDGAQDGFKEHLKQSNYALSALIAKHTYMNLSKQEQDKADEKALNIMYDRILKNSGLELNSHDESMKMVKKSLELSKAENIWGYWLFMAMILMELGIKTIFNEEWYISDTPFLQLINEEKYALQGMRDYLKDTYHVNII